MKTSSRHPRKEADGAELAHALRGEEWGCDLKWVTAVSPLPMPSSPPIPVTPASRVEEMLVLTSGQSPRLNLAVHAPAA
ncbi:hypothetical protein SKAU_G00027870 [Synaphobranchus kaupii]|uniref:Uncharacterized protein n=1 Tax=Synaphobranchus kaupii TaxID=118154 RepID=A0A9Q1GD70_SYNKA|nr:hypothetical protein SKAU_G00027870 [Synaphobranchus kaupii]